MSVWRRKRYWWKRGMFNMWIVLLRWASSCVTVGYELIERYVVIYMDNSLIWWSYLMLEECVQRRIISLWVSCGSASWRSKGSGKGDDRHAPARKNQRRRWKAKEKPEGTTWDAKVIRNVGTMVDGIGLEVIVKDWPSQLGLQGRVDRSSPILTRIYDPLRCSAPSPPRSGVPYTILVISFRPPNLTDANSQATL